MRATAQKTQILQALKMGESMTPWDALQRYGCFRLAARIGELREDGHAITTTIVNDTDRRYASYRLGGA